jgi:acetyl-CoA C-acetyltransferase
MSDPIVIVAAARTPMGGFMGDFACADLRPARQRQPSRPPSSAPGSSPEQVEEVIMGCVLPAGQGQAPARQASLGAGLPLGAGCTTVNKMCGSGMKATMLAHDLLAAGSEPRHGRRRHGEHEQRALPAAQGAHRLPPGPREVSTTCSSTASKTPTTRAA